MKVKIYLGIIIPLFVVAVLVLLSNSKIGFSVGIVTEKSIEFKDLFASFNKENRALVQSINITNNFFLPRKFEIPEFIICIHDKEGIKEMQDFEIKYSENVYSSSNSPFVEELFLDYSSYGSNVVDLKSNSKKQVKIFIIPNDKKVRLRSFEGYDELLLIEKENEDNGYSSYSYNPCTNVQSDEIAEALIITIINQTYEEQVGDLKFKKMMSDTLKEDSIRTYTIDGLDYEIEVLGIDVTSKTVSLSVNGQEEELGVSENAKLFDGTVIGVDKINLDGEPSVEFYLGK